MSRWQTNYLKSLARFKRETHNYGEENSNAIHEREPGFSSV